MRATAVVAALLATTIVPATAEAGTRRVAPGELASVLRDAQPGDTLILGTGVHPGPIEIGVAVRIEGEPGASIDGPGTGTTVTVTADGVELVGLTVRGSGKDLSEDDAVIRLLEVHGVTVEGCDIRARAFGIYLAQGGDHRVIRNVVTGDRDLAIARRGNGIHLWDTKRNEVRGNEIVDVRDAVYLSFAHDNLIAENRASNLRYGIHYMYSERNHLLENVFDRCSGGIALMYSFENRIEGNVVTNNRDFGILCQSLERSVVVGNRVAGNGRGFFLENSSANRFESNLIEVNGVGVFVTAGSERNVFTENWFSGNVVHVYQNVGSVSRWSDRGRGNRWDDYRGFDWDGDEVGETPYRLHTAASSLMARQPVARWFWMSPAMALLDWWEARVRAVDVDALDPAPLVGW